MEIINFQATSLSNLTTPKAHLVEDVCQRQVFDDARRFAIEILCLAMCIFCTLLILEILAAAIRKSLAQGKARYRS